MPTTFEHVAFLIAASRVQEIEAALAAHDRSGGEEPLRELLERAAQEDHRRRDAWTFTPSSAERTSLSALLADTGLPASLTQLPAQVRADPWKRAERAVAQLRSLTALQAPAIVLEGTRKVL